MSACRWSLIVGNLPGRTDNEIKNHWNSHLSRQIHTFRGKKKYTAGSDNTVTIDTSKLRSDDKRRGGRTPATGRSPKSATSCSKTTKSNQPDPEPEPESGNAKGASSPATAATSAVHSDGARPGSGFEGPFIEDATGPWELDPIEPRDIWEAESDTDALMSIGEAQVDDLFYMGWDGFAAHIWGGPSTEVQQAAQPQAAGPDEHEPQAADAACTTDEHELEALETWLLSDSF